MYLVLWMGMVSSGDGLLSRLYSSSVRSGECQLVLHHPLQIVTGSVLWYTCTYRFPVSVIGFLKMLRDELVLFSISAFTG